MGWFYVISPLTVAKLVLATAVLSSKVLLQSTLPILPQKFGVQLSIPASFPVGNINMHQLDRPRCQWFIQSVLE